MRTWDFSRTQESAKMRKNDSLDALYRRPSLVGTISHEIQKRRRRVMGGTNPAQIPTKLSNHWIHIALFKTRNVDL